MAMVQRKSMWDDDPILEEMGPGGSPAEKTQLSSGAGWGSGSLSAFGQSWVEALEPAVDQEAALPKNDGEGAKRPVSADLHKNVAMLHGIAAPQVFESTRPRRVRSRA